MNFCFIMAGSNRVSTQDQKFCTGLLTITAPLTNCGRIMLDKEDTHEEREGVVIVKC